ncbi:MAG: cyclic nucleotide-binding domain-containing protein, partial [Pseudomonadota bacterium]
MSYENSSRIRTHRCPQCSLRDLCIRAGFDDAEINYIGEEYTRAHRPYEKGERISRFGKSAARSLYIIKSGAIKTEAINQDGQPRVTGFYLTGEIVGFETLGAEDVLSDAITLTRTWICELPSTRLESLCSSSPPFQSQVLQIMSREIHRREHELVISPQLTANEKVTQFLGHLYRRTQLHRTDSGTGRINLPMRKGDIARYLGLDPSTLSRVLANFEK